MKQTLLFVSAVVGTGAALAQPPATAMKFLSAPAFAEGAGGVRHRMLRADSGDTTTVVVKDPAPCGARGTEATFDVVGGTLRLRYKLPAADAKALARGCVATAVFTLKNLPDRVLAVEAQADRGRVDDTLASAATAPAATMKFISAPALPATMPPVRTVLQTRFRDRMTVVVHEPAQCGARPIEPSFDVEGGTVRLKYRIDATGAPSRADCIATAVFALRDLPDADLHAAVDIEHTSARLAQLPASTASMRFLSVPAFATPGISRRDVYQAKYRDTLTVVVREPADCGQRPANPSFAVTSQTLHLRYDLPGDELEAARGDCAAVAVFTLKDLPARELNVVAEAARTPVMLAAARSERK